MAWTKRCRTEAGGHSPLILNAIDERPDASYVGRVRPARDPLLQFMILLSALLASLSGLVAGERAPVGAPAQVQASAIVSAAQSEAVVAVSQVRQLAAPVRIASPDFRVRTAAYAAPQPDLRTRLTLKQSWLE